ncbi:hypothetical protein AAMO2058_000742100 [Amorphochlora amoebiformis]
MPPLEPVSPISKESPIMSRKKSTEEPQGKGDVKHPVEAASDLPFELLNIFSLESSRGYPTSRALASPDEIYRASISSLDAKVAQARGQAYIFFCHSFSKRHTAAIDVPNYDENDIYVLRSLIYVHGRSNDRLRALMASTRSTSRS